MRYNKEIIDHKETKIPEAVSIFLRFALLYFYLGIGWVGKYDVVMYRFRILVTFGIKSSYQHKGNKSWDVGFCCWKCNELLVFYIVNGECDWN